MEAPPLTQSAKSAEQRNPLVLGWGEQDFLKRRLDDLASLSPIPPSPPISCGAIGRFLCNAIDGEQAELALALVELGADVNCLHPTRKITALTVAAELGDTEAIKCGVS